MWLLMTLLPVTLNAFVGGIPSQLLVGHSANGDGFTIYWRIYGSAFEQLARRREVSFQFSSVAVPKLTKRMPYGEKENLLKILIYDRTPPCITVFSVNLGYVAPPLRFFVYRLGNGYYRKYRFYPKYRFYSLYPYSIWFNVYLSHQVFMLVLMFVLVTLLLGDTHLAS